MTWSFERSIDPLQCYNQLIRYRVYNGALACPDIFYLLERRDSDPNTLFVEGPYYRQSLESQTLTGADTFTDKCPNAILGSFARWLDFMVKAIFVSGTVRCRITALRTFVTDTCV